MPIYIDKEMLEKIEKRKEAENTPISIVEAEKIMKFLKENCQEKSVNLFVLCEKCAIKPYRMHQVFKVLKALPFVQINFVKGVNLIKYEGGQIHKAKPS